MTVPDPGGHRCGAEWCAVAPAGGPRRPSKVRAPPKNPIYFSGGHWAGGSRTGRRFAVRWRGQAHMGLNPGRPGPIAGRVRLRYGARLVSGIPRFTGIPVVAEQVKVDTISLAPSSRGGRTVEKHLVECRSFGDYLIERPSSSREPGFERIFCRHQGSIAPVMTLGPPPSEFASKGGFLVPLFIEGPQPKITGPTAIGPLLRTLVRTVRCERVRTSHAWGRRRRWL